MKIYTKTGDLGQTGLFGGPRVAKDTPRIEAYGTVDELNAVLGVVRASGPAEVFERPLARVQNQLFDLGAELASPEPMKFGLPGVPDEHITALEREIDAWEIDLAPLRQFILPGGTLAASQLHVARTVCRRAERRVITLAATPNETVDQQIIIYLNRLSDWLFVLARAVNHHSGIPDTPWQKS